MLADDEIEVVCKDCNAKLHNASIYDDTPKDAIIFEKAVLISCPRKDKCREEAEEIHFERFGKLFPYYH